MTQGGTMASSRAVGARKGRFGVIKTGKFIGTACSHGAWQSVLDHRLQHELREAYGAENARKVLQAIMDTMEEDGSGPFAAGQPQNCVAYYTTVGFMPAHP
jgi:hypothetical protein